MNRLIIAALALCVFPFAAHGQTAPAGRGPAPLAIPNPHYVSIEMEVDVERPAAEVWKRVGKYCDIGEWFQMSCTMFLARTVKLESSAPLEMK